MNPVPEVVRQTGTVSRPQNEPSSVWDFNPRGSVRARFMDKFALDVTQVLASSKRLENRSRH